MNKNRTRAPEKRLLRIKSSSILEVLPESRSGSPQSGILASGSSVRTAPSHSNSCNGCKGFLNLCLLGHPRLQWRDRCGFAPHSSVPWSISIIRDRIPGVKRRGAKSVFLNIGISKDSILLLATDGSRTRFTSLGSSGNTGIRRSQWCIRAPSGYDGGD